MSARVRRIGILGHTERPQVRRIAADLMRRLTRRGLQVKLDARLAAAMEREDDGTPLRQLARWCQLLVTLGGD
ncbi:MAG: hypothetical protein ABIS67_12710, partial [Candidatus Eisenbacteria bacterium]